MTQAIKVYVEQNEVVGRLNDLWEQMDLRDHDQRIISNQLERLIKDLGGFYYGGPGAEPLIEHIKVYKEKELTLPS